MSSDSSSRPPHQRPPRQPRQPRQARPQAADPTSSDPFSPLPSLSPVPGPLSPVLNSTFPGETSGRPNQRAGAHHGAGSSPPASDRPDSSGDASDRPAATDPKPKRPRKARGGKTFHNTLSEAQRTELGIWLTDENITYKAAIARLIAHWRISATENQLHRFYYLYALPDSYKRDAAHAKALGKVVGNHFTKASSGRVKQLAFQALAGKKPDIRAAQELIKLLGDTTKMEVARERVALDARKVALLEEKAAQADEAASVSRDTMLTPEQKDARIRAIFGLIS